VEQPTKKWSFDNFLLAFAIVCMSIQMIVNVTKFVNGTWDGNTADLLMALGKEAFFIIVVWKILPSVFKLIDKL